ncbi:MAG TPA: hypothetical protein VNW68_03420, partial [Candidatus Limnocylindria bacterium]|nr:hypothetical protein [Candidatus Limnocylindria bacterium]
MRRPLIVFAAVLFVAACGPAAVELAAVGAVIEGDRVRRATGMRPRHLATGGDADLRRLEREVDDG